MGAGPAGCIVHINKVSKPVMGKYLLLCMNSIMYFLLTSYTLNMYLKVLSHFIMKIKKNSWNISKKGSWNISKFPWSFLNISKWNKFLYFNVHPYLQQRWPRMPLKKNSEVQSSLVTSSRQTGALGDVTNSLWSLPDNYRRESGESVTSRRCD